ncbi:MAG: rhomboid family intramembrane serine protease [Weeksellaceae bacterium]|nr:rhomboid family intramembrane serine protease [Weeksellaceae bacterium]
MEWIDNLKKNFKQGDFVIKIIYINVAIFVLVRLILLFSDRLRITEYLGIIAYIDDIASKPWTLITYMFLHIDIFHILFNMVFLYFVGRFFYQFFNQQALAKFYIFGGIAGGLLYTLYALIYPSNNILMGASAAIYSVLFGLAAYQPDYRIRLLFIETPIRIMHLAIGFLVLGFLLHANNFGGNLSHAGGALFGYYYMKQYERGQDFLAWFDKLLERFSTRRTGPLRSTRTTKKRTSTAAQQQNAPVIPPKNDYDYNSLKVEKEQETNRILEKISRSGYNSLTEQEKDFLFKQGK